MKGCETMNKSNYLIINDICYKKLNMPIDNAKFIGGGSFGKVYKTILKNGRIIVLKIFMSENIADKEAVALKQLAKNNEIKVPEVYFLHHKDISIPYDCIGMEYINGRNALFNIKLLTASKAKKEAFAFDVIKGISAIQKITNDKFGFINNAVYDTWQDFYEQYANQIYYNAYLKYKENKFDKYIFDVMTEAIAEFDKIFSDKVRTATLIHGDLNVMNMMVDDNLKLKAFIDPLNSMYADKEYELFQLKNLTGNCFNLFNEYKKHNAISENCEIKMAFYSLWNEAMVYINTGRYTKCIMHSAIKNMKRQLKKIK